VGTANQLGRRRRTVFVCSACGAESPRWSGQCAGCGVWNALGEQEPSPAGRAPAAAPALSLASVDVAGGGAVPTGIGEVDRVLGGGLLPGSVTLVFGEPGVGKSTLLLQVLRRGAVSGDPVLLVSAEESAAQVRQRAGRLGDLPASLMVCATADLAGAEAAIGAVRPRLVVVDSVQALADAELGGAPGSLAQVRHVVDRLHRCAKADGVTVVLVGHVTKDGDVAGPRTLEHQVDTVLAFEGDRHHSLRLLRAVKHRFGATGEVGLFEMGDEGLAAVDDPGPLLLGDRLPDVPGSALCALVQGRRPLVAEIQALVGPAAVSGGAGGPRRSAQGLDPRRLATVLAVLECRAQVALAGHDVLCSVAGGVQATEPAADLALALAVASAATGRALPADLVAFGEIGLAGEVRQVPGAARRLQEAARLGCRLALVPAGTPAAAGPVRAVTTRTVADALGYALGERPVGPEAAGSRAGTMQGWPSEAATR
jgi:DNA repair protein RadA/Sms